MYSVILPDGYRVDIACDTWERTISVKLSDLISDMHISLATFCGGRWVSEYQSNLRKFLDIARKYADVRDAIKCACIKLRTSENLEYEFYELIDMFLQKLRYLFIKK